MTASEKQRLGTYGEALAARHLCEAGMVLLDRNWRGDGGELDLVLRDGDDLVVCEVKTRRSAAYGAPLEAVDARKTDRMRRLAAQWMAVHGVRAQSVRFDLVGVIRRGSGFEIDHVKGVG